MINNDGRYDRSHRKEMTSQLGYPRQYISQLRMTINERDHGMIQLKDYGNEPFAINIEVAAKQNDAYRTALWTGEHLQVTLMSIDYEDDIGLERHPHLDQFIMIVEGQGRVKMGATQDGLHYQEKVHAGYAFVIPAGIWHNLVNTGDQPLKLFSIYAPPEHPKGTIHQTKEIAEEEEHNHL